MTDRFEGQVLRGARVSPANARSTAESTTGVVRFPQTVPTIYDEASEAPVFVDAFADQYRAGLLEAPGNTAVEYVVWAQNTGSLAMVEDASWWVSEATGSIPQGSLVVANTTPEGEEPAFYDDGSDRAVLVDDGNRSLGAIYFIVVARGDVDNYDDDGWTNPDDPFAGRSGSNPYLQLFIEVPDQDAQAGVIRLTDAQLALLDGGLSLDRGDRIVTSVYTLSPVKFYWTRNDRYETRFGWNGQKQRWEPFKGSTPPNLGTLLFDESYQMAPKVTNLPINAILPGGGNDSDVYAMIRLGSDPGAGSTPVGIGDPDGFAGIQVKNDDVVDAGFDFSTSPALAGVMGQTTGKLAFNPAYVQLHAGTSIWYSYKNFTEDAEGIVGPLLDASLNPLFIAPIPGPTDAPLLRIGNRRYLSVTLADDDAELESLPTPGSGQVIVSLSTGRLKLSPDDTAKADPDNTVAFDKYYLGNYIIYDGVALNQVPQPTKAPVALVDETGAVAEAGTTSEFFIPLGVTLPDTDSGVDTYRGLGRSGIVDAPDETGSLPVDPTLPGSSRPGGDSTGDKNTGRLRSVEDGVGDTLIFSRTSSTGRVLTRDFDDDLPGPSYKVRRGQAYVSREATLIPGQGFCSRVSLSRTDLRSWSGNEVYFLQSTFTPATYTIKGRVVSKSRDIFRFEGTEVLYFAIDGQLYQWASSNLTGSDFYTATEVAASITADSDQLPGPGTGLTAGTCYEKNGRVILGATDETSGTVEIGWGTGGVKDLSGAAVLGFMPGWKAVGGITNWLPDGGTAMGMFRSPLNLDRSRATADFRDTARYEGEVIQEDVQATPFQFLDDVPLQDVAGLDENIYFSISTIIDDGIAVAIVQKTLDHYDDIVYRFGLDKFDWVARDTISEAVEAAVSNLDLQNAGVVPESMLGAPGIGGGLYVSEAGGAAEFQELDSDYLLPEGGTPGIAVLTEKFGNRVATGARGELTAGSDIFTDNSDDVDFTDLEPGYRLKILSGGDPVDGSYIVQEVVDPKNLRIAPTPTATPEQLVTWAIYEGLTEAVYDPSIVADTTYKEFNHLQEEPFVVKLLSPVGLVPTDATEQENNRLFAYMEKALASNRNIWIRYGLTAATVTNTASMIELTQTELGTLANNALVVPETDTTRFTSESFDIKVGVTEYTHDSGLLTGVPTFSPDPNSGDGIEYLTVEALVDGVLAPVGQLKFGSNILVSYVSSQVYYAQAFQPPADLADLTVEYQPEDGTLNFSATDMASLGGTVQAYFVEQMITEERKDVTINPLLGAFSFSQPITTNSTVEVSYWQADLEGRKVGDHIIEFLPVYIRDEEAVRDTNDTLGGTFYFNVDPRRTIDQRIAPVVYIGAVMQNYNEQDYILEYLDDGRGKLSFNRNIVDTVTVKVSYAVLEAVGGERAYESSIKPCYRPPFFIEADQERFGLRGDRVDEFEAGQMLRIGSETYYIESTKYYPLEDDGTGDVTAVYIFPHTTNEVGSRSPGNDVISVISDRPITTVVDPDGESPIPTTAAAGLMSTVDISQFSFEPINRGQTEVIFLGDLTEFAVPGHILEVGGEPHTIAQAVLNDDGTRTIVTVTAGFKTGTSMDEEPTVKLTYRPIYPPQTRDFGGVGPMVVSEPYELVLYGETDSDGNELPGRTLIETVDYDLDTDSGDIKLLEPLQEALGPNQRLVFMFTRLRVLQPFWGGGVVSFPRFFASYLYSSSPSTENTLLGAQLLGTYTYRAPDTFYYRVVSVPEFLVEAAQEAVSDITSREPAGGTITSAGGGQDNWEQGRIGLKSERSHLEDQDRAARAFLEFYNSSVISFEQIQETISGGFIGDRDGKFRFWVGRDRDYPTPGYEDDISGELVQRNIWSEVFNQADPDAELFYQTTDWIVTPGSQSLNDGDLSGSFPDPDRTDKLIDQQRVLVQNDVDDFVMVTLGKPKMTFKLRYPFFFYKVKGRFRSLYQRSEFSRIFPGRTRAFFMSFPGVGGNQETEDPDAWNAGYYTYGRVFFGDKKRTHGKTIGQLRNPAHGDVDRGVSTAKLYRRRARARIWGYFPNGIPAFSFQGGTQPLADITDPCVIAFPALLRDIPVDPGTGFPDDSQLISQGYGLNNSDAWLPDSEAGDPELIVPGFEPGNEISLGRPDGTTYDGFSNPVTINIPAITGFTPLSSYQGLYIRDILYGCVIRFDDESGNPITNDSNLLVGISSDVGVPFSEFPVEAHDTIFAGPPLKKRTASVPDPTGQNDIIELAQGLDDYRSGFDVTVKSDGRVVDKTWPSFYDPSFFGIKELFGQHPPSPLDYLEADVEFYYDGQNPFEFPALRGETTDDSGDYQIPYIKAANTEMDRFDEAMVGIAPVMTEVDNLYVPPPPAAPPVLTRNYYVYPDEILGNDGTVVNASGASWLQSSAATLITEEDVRHFLHGDPESGIGDAHRYDLMLIQVGTTPFDSGGPTDGPMGISSIGDVSATFGSGSKLEPPRFITQTTPPTVPGPSPVTPSPVRYAFGNAMAFTNPGAQGYGVPAQTQVPAPPGCEIFEDNVAGVTVLDFSSVGSFSLNDGNTAGVGNLNHFIAADLNNTVAIKLINRPDQPFVQNAPAFGPIPTYGPPPPDSTVSLTIFIQQAQVWADDFAGNRYGPFALGAAPVFGTTHPAPVVPVADNKQIVIPLVGFIPWPPLYPIPGGTNPNEWFIPYQVVGPDNQMLYGFEFTFDIATVDPITVTDGQSDTAWIGPDRLTFHEVYDLRMAKDRNYVHPVSGLGLEAQLIVQEVTTWHPSVPGPGTMWSTINAGINGFIFFIPHPLTFKPHDNTYPADSAGGDWTAKTGVGDFERGSLKVMAFEGHHNAEITASDVTFTAIPSDDYSSVGIICAGSGDLASQFNTDLPAGGYDPLLVDNRVLNPVLTGGGLSRIESGDILVVEENSNLTHLATTKAGTYVVKHAVEDEGGDPRYRITAPVTTTGSESGWCPVHFPNVVSFDWTAFPGSTQTLTITDPASTRGGHAIGPDMTGFPASGDLYIIKNASDLASSTLTEQQNAVIIVAYTGRTISNGQLTFTGLSNYRYADGAPIYAVLATEEQAEEINGLINNSAYQVSGMDRLPVNVSGADYGLPENNTVGWHDTAAGIFAGFQFVTFKPIYALWSTAASSSILFDGTAAGITFNAAAGPTQVSVWAATPTPYLFEDDELASAYDYVVETLRVDGLNAADWTNLNVFGTLKCLLPGMSLEIQSNAAPFPPPPPPPPPVPVPGHYAQVGIFLESSVPRSALDLVEPQARVVDAGHSLPDPGATIFDVLREIGMRDAKFYDASGGVLSAPENVNFEVRRIRRWHDIMDEAESNLTPLSYAYEIRRGIITGYTTNLSQRGILTASGFTMDWDTANPTFPHQPDAWNDGQTYTGTNLGPFNVDDVNINTGDAFRLIDEYGDLVEEVPIESVDSAGQVTLSAPGLQTSSVIGMRFEVYLRQAPVPHEQSNEQLLDLITDRVVHRTFSDWGEADEKGGYVPDMEALPTPDWDDTANRLMDDLNAPASGDFSALGIQKGDILIVDPVGKIPRSQGGLPSTQEQGARPIGDDGVADRVPSYTKGWPDDRDDNRGYYRVKRVVDTANPPYVEVDPISTYSGDVNSDVIFGAIATNDRQYAVYPTVHESQLRKYFVQDEDEGQMDLLPTYSRAVNGTFSSYANPNEHREFYSIRPFDYTVIRPSGLFSDEAIDLVLMMRERMLSWIEMIRATLAGYKSGSYFVFQRDQHISDLGSTTNPQAGLGVLSNDYITSILGRLDVTPYVNNESCLSLLDRRFWIQDWRLDFLTTDPAFPTLQMKRVAGAEVPYTAYNDFSTGGVVRPVLPERVDEVLDTRDRFRPIRYVWLAYRTHLILGTLASIQRFDEELPERQEEQRRLLLLEDSIEGVTDD